MKLTDLVEGEEYAWDRGGISEKWKVTFTGRTAKKSRTGRPWEKRTITVAVVQVVQFGDREPGHDLREVEARKLEPWAVYEAVRDAAARGRAERENLIEAVDNRLIELGLPLSVHSSFAGYTLFPHEGLSAVLEALKQLERNS